MIDKAPGKLYFIALYTIRIFTKASHGAYAGLMAQKQNKLYTLSETEVLGSPETLLLGDINRAIDY